MSIPSQYISPIDLSKIDAIKTGILHDIYSKFAFLDINLPSIYPNGSSNLKKNFEDSLIAVLKQFKFISYNYIDISRNKDKNDSSFNFVNSSICVEGNCFIIKSIDKNFLMRILKKTESKLVSTEDSLVNKEVTNFCASFNKAVLNNEFLQITIQSVLSYIIRRYFCPTYYFNDPSFFNFEQQNNSFEEENKRKFSNILFSVNHSQYQKNSQIFLNDQTHNSKSQIYEFQKSDFIILRLLYSNRNTNFYLVFHIKSHYIFMMKVSKVRDQNTTFQREIDFCQNMSHRCLNRFYGFLQEDGEKIGFIYEFLSNGSLSEFLNENKNQSDLFSYISINRIFQGIEYIHSKSYIHRDLKPDNILLNHDNIPYICDFDAIRFIDESKADKEVLTDDIGSNYYVSPEQYSGGIEYSYSTDIYSFGLLIYFIFERKTWTSLSYADSINQQKKNEDFRPMKNGTKNIQNLYLSCVKYNRDERCSLNEIRNVLFNDAKSVDYFENYLLKEATKVVKLSEIVQYAYENTFIIYDHIKSLNDTMIYVYILFLLLNCQLKILMNQIKLIIQNDYPVSSNFFGPNIDSNIYLILGTFYEKGEDVKRDYLKARNYYVLAARLYNIKAVVNIGYLYINGLGVVKDEKIAMKCFEIAAQQNDPDGLLNLGNIYKNNPNILNNCMKAKECYERSAKQNNSIALFQLGNLNMEDRGIKKDYSKAREYYELSANLNNSDSLYELGNIYYYGLGVDRNFFKAKSYFEKAAIQNNPDALLNLGVMNEFGVGTELNCKKAFEYYELAAKLNNSTAFNNLGILYHLGKGVPKDPKKAIQYYELGAKQNNPMSFYLLGNYYHINFDGERDYLKAKKYYEKAAYCKNRFALSNLGILYLKGLGVKQSYSKAIEYFEFAAELNDPYALLNLSCMYENGIGVKRDLSKAWFYYKSAAKLNNPEGLLELGIQYLNGRTVEKDLFKGIQYIELSSKFNNPLALYQLAYIYENEIYFNQNLEKAIILYSKRIASQSGQVALYDQHENIFIHQYLSNSYNYISNNNLGLIYYIHLNNKIEAYKCIQTAAFNEYPPAQSNYGFILQYEKKDYKNAEYFLDKASKKKFSIAEYNLGYLYEQTENFERAIQFYMNASDHENEPLVFQNLSVYENRLEISKMFILCLTNLKLTKINLLRSNFKSAKKYFKRALSKIIFETKDLPRQFTSLTKKEAIKNIKKFILSCPLFNLVNQPNLKHLNLSKSCNFYDERNIETKENEKENTTVYLKSIEIKKMNQKVMKNGQKFESTEYEKNQDKCIYNNNYNNNINDNIYRKIILNSSIIEKLNENKIEKKLAKDEKFENLDELFDFVIQNKDLLSTFISSIKDTIGDMNKILYQPPFQILFGAINLTKSKTESEKNENLYSLSNIIDESFYEGLGVDI